MVTGDNNESGGYLHARFTAGLRFESISEQIRTITLLVMEIVRVSQQLTGVGSRYEQGT